jgi:hypothetical protein
MTPSREWVARLVELAGLSPGQPVLKLDAGTNPAALPYEDNAFDAVLCQDLTALDDQVAALREMGRVGALVAVLVPSRNPPVNEPALLAELFATAGLEFRRVRTLLSSPGVVDCFVIISRPDPRLSPLREPRDPPALPGSLDGSMLVVRPGPSDRVDRRESG